MDEVTLYNLHNAAAAGSNAADSVMAYVRQLEKDYGKRIRALEKKVAKLEGK